VKLEYQEEPLQIDYEINEGLLMETQSECSSEEEKESNQNLSQ